MKFQARDHVRAVVAQHRIEVDRPEVEVVSIAVFLKQNYQKNDLILTKSIYLTDSRSSRSRSRSRSHSGSAHSRSGSEHSRSRSGSRSASGSPNRSGSGSGSGSE